MILPIRSGAGLPPRFGRVGPTPSLTMRKQLSAWRRKMIPRAGKKEGSDVQRRDVLRVLLDEFVAHRFHSRVDRSVRGDNDDLHPGGSREQDGNQVQAARRAQAKIDERHVERPAGRLRDGVLEITDGGHVVAFGFQADGEGLPNVALVVDDEDIDGSAGLRRRGHGPPFTR